MIVIAFDASIVHTGYAVIDTGIKILPKSLLDSGTISAKKDDDLTAKVVLLGHKIEELCKTHKPDAIVIERAEAFAYKGRKNLYGKSLNVDSMAKNALSVGVIAGIASLYCADIVFVSAQTWKGMQRKEVTRLVVNNEYGLKLKRVNNDESDAIAISGWYRRELKFKKMMRKQ